MQNGWATEEAKNFARATTYLEAIGGKERSRKERSHQENIPQKHSGTIHTSVETSSGYLIDQVGQSMLQKAETRAKDQVRWAGHQ